jgi:hypothetical protein
MLVDLLRGQNIELVNTRNSFKRKAPDGGFSYWVGLFMNRVFSCALKNTFYPET